MSPPPERLMGHQSYDRAAPRRLRKAAGLSIASAAKRARVSAQAIRYLESGTSSPTAVTLAKLAVAYGCSVVAFFKVRGVAA
jgi:transcriptional regulator with XRE-family HTH domain